MKTKLTILIVITLLTFLLGYGICGVMKAQLEIQQDHTQRAIEKNADLKKFFGE